MVIEQKVIVIYAQGMTVRQISEQVQDICEFEISEGMEAAITNKPLPEIGIW